MAKPIFVIGWDRSGTKWLSNIIAIHKEVACVQHECHFGILEASDIIFTAPILFGNLNIPENYITFVESLSQTDFFRITGFDKNYCYKLKPTSYLAFFKDLMDRFAEKEGKTYWIQKSGIISMNDLYKHFREGKFILIIRNMKDNIWSKIGQRKLNMGENPPKNIIKESINYFIDIKQINKLSKQNNVYIIHYEELRKNKKSVIEDLCKFLQIEFDETMLQDKFRKNTSFRDGVSRDEILSGSDILIMEILSFFHYAIPGWAYEYLYSRKKRRIAWELFNSREKRFISLKLQKKELGWD